MKQLHELQRIILKKLLFAPHLRYSDMKPSKDTENNQFQFHVDTLTTMGYITKSDRYYELTQSGKEYANRIDTDTTEVKKQAKISAWVCARKTIGNQRQYLLYTRLKQPFYGAQGFMSGKVGYGETVLEAAKRELQEETGLIGEPYHIGTFHYRVFDQVSKELIEDKFMFLCNIDEPQGEIRPHNEGLYEWISESDFKEKVTNHFESFESFLHYIDVVKKFSGTAQLFEIDHYTSKF